MSLAQVENDTSLALDKRPLDKQAAELLRQRIVCGAFPLGFRLVVLNNVRRPYLQINESNGPEPAKQLFSGEPMMHYAGDIFCVECSIFKR
jgi:hypothetical protein